MSGDTETEQGTKRCRMPNNAERRDGRRRGSVLLHSRDTVAVVCTRGLVVEDVMSGRTWRVEVFAGGLGFLERRERPDPSAIRGEMHVLDSHTDAELQ